MLQIIPSFNAGELSPRLESRVDLEKYGAGCRVLENMVIMPYGGVNRRPGLEFLGSAKFADKKARLVGFNFSVTTNFVVEFGDGYVRFWSNGVPVLDEGGPVEVVSPYEEADLFALQYVQINDVMYITHPDYPVHKLSRLADDEWALDEVEWDFPPFREANDLDTTISIGEPDGFGIRILTASAPLFTEGNVGGYYRIDHKREDVTERIRIKTEDDHDEHSGVVRVIGGWEFHTKGTWSGKVRLERSEDGLGDWEVIRSYEGEKDFNVTAAGTQERAAYFRITVVDGANDDTTAPLVPSGAYLQLLEATVSGVVRITGYTSPTVVQAEVVVPLYSTSATKDWAEGAWSARRGFPRTVTMYEQRLMFGGNVAESQTVWASAVGDFEYFRWATLDDSAFTFALASQENNQIQWMLSQRALCIGTSGDEYLMDSANPEKAIGATSVRVKRQSRYGSKHLAALLVNEVALFVQRQGRKVREFVYNFEKDGYVSPDLTLLAEHVTEGGLEQMAFQQQPDAIVWCVSGGGILAGMTYERDQNVVGWHRHTTQGFFESVATIYSDDSADEVWCIVRREVDGETVRYVERMDPNFRATLDAQAKADWFYVDAGVTRESEELMEAVDGLEHLEGMTVSILADGAVQPDRVVTDGEMELQLPARKVQVGLAYTSMLKPMAIEPRIQGMETAQGRRARVNRLGVRFFRCLGAEVETERGRWEAIEFRDTADPMDASPEAFTGTKMIVVAGDFRDTGDVGIRQRQPLPMSILALMPRVDFYGD